MYKILVLCSVRSGGLDGGQAMISEVIEFELESQAEKAILNIVEHRYYSVKVIRLY
jgi:hypothetical protein